MARELPRIAVIDDDSAFVQMMGDILTDEGYRMLGCSQGDAAYAFIWREQPDLIVLDIRLEYPDSGWRVLRLIRLDPTLHTLPIIICTADLRFLKQRERQLHAYGCGILNKPFSIDALLHEIKMRLQAPLSREAAQ